jgi:hypothetical protein
METRKDFIKRSGAVLGAIFGVSRVITMGSDLFADEPESAVATRLSFIDINRCNEALAAIDSFGSVAEDRRFSQSVFTANMNLGRYTSNYIRTIQSRFPLRNHTNLPERMEQAAGLGNAYLALLSHLTALLGEWSFNYFNILRDRLSTIENLNREISHFTSIADAFDRVRQSWRAGDRYLVNDTEYETIRIPLFENGPPVELSPVCIRSVSRSIQRLQESLNRKGGNSVPCIALHDSSVFDLLDQIERERGRFKSLYSKYKLLNLYQYHNRILPDEEETVSRANRITSGSNSFIGKVMLTYLLVEIILMRIRLLANQCRSGIFSSNNRNSCNYEVRNLILLIDEIVEQTSFSRVPVFEDRFDTRPAEIIYNENRVRIRLQPLSSERLSLQQLSHRYNTVQPVSVSSAAGAGNVYTTCGTALAAMRQARERILQQLGES